MSIVVPKNKQRLWVVISIWLVIAVGLFAFASFLKPSVTSNQVRLIAPIAGQNVQMFADPGSGTDAFADFPHRTQCTKVSGPIRADLGSGITSDYYQLTCKGTTGYVNAKWVAFD